MLLKKYLIFVSIALMTVILSACGRQSSLNNTNSASDQLQPTIFALSPPAVLGIVVDGDGNVIQVEQEGSASIGGIQVGDKIVSFNEQKVTPSNLKNLPEQIANSESKPATVIVLRKGNEIKLTVKPTPPRARPEQPTATPVPNNQQYL